jgi:hypothetical protein
MKSAMNLAANDNYDAETTAQEDLEARVVVALELMTVAEVRYLVREIDAKLRHRPLRCLVSDSLG